MTSFRFRLPLAAGAFLAMHLLLAWWRPVPRLWGVDLLAWCPLWVRVAFAVAAALLLWTAARVRLTSAPGVPPSPSGSQLPAWRFRASVASGLAVAAAVTLFVAAPSAVHLLGDGYLYLREASRGVSRQGYEPLSFWLFERLRGLGEPLWGSAETSMRLLSRLSGLVYVALSVAAARLLGRDRTEGAIVLAFLLTAGYVQLFCAYCETYAVLMPAILLYLLCGLLVLRGRLSLAVAAMLGGILPCLHFVLAALAPSLLVLALLRARAARDAGPPWRIAGAVALAPVTCAVLLWALDARPAGSLARLGESLLLPLVAAPSFNQAYRLLSWRHLLDFANQQLLAAPAAVLSLVAIRWQRDSWREEPLFVLSAAGGLLAASFVMNPEIGAFRDWDLLSLPALPLTLWAAMAVVGHTAERPVRARAGILIAGAAGLHTLLWIGVNADAGRAEARFADLLANGSLSPHARSYGWESLAAYRRDAGDRTGALVAFREAVDAHPTNARHWALLGDEYRHAGEYAQAAAAYRSALECAHPDSASLWRNLGFAYMKMGASDDALRAYGRALQLRPGDATTWLNLGKLLRATGALERAIGALGAAVAVDPGLVPAHEELLAALTDAGRWEQAVEAGRAALATAPASALVHWYLMAAHDALGQDAETARHGCEFLRYWQGDARHADWARRRLAALGEPPP